MNGEKPQSIDEYKEWLKNKHAIEISDSTQAHYESVMNRVKEDFEKSEFWVQLTGNLGGFDGEYYTETGFHLLIRNLAPELRIKRFDSFLLKTFRKNIIENKDYPAEPRDGWVLPSNWYFRINDTIRTLFEVKYLDGVKFMIDKIEALCQELDMPCMVTLEAKEEGYYAAHLYTSKQFEVPKVPYDTEMVEVRIELQITTQLQEVIRTLLHKYYEESRKRVGDEDTKWQWNYLSDEFATNYLGHILHYVEGMIMEIREKQRGEMT